MFLTPLMLYISWSVFIFSTSTVVSLVTLLITSLGFPLIFMKYVKIFWPCGLFLILMTTGLIVIFAYIVSLHPKEGKSGLPAATLFALSLMAMDPTLSTLQKVYHPNSGVFMTPLPSVLLILVLLFLVVAFIRIVYSKGGGFRKKF